MLIKFQSDNEEFHDRLLAATGLGTVTGAYRSAAVQYPGLKSRIRHLQTQLDELKYENMALRKTLIDAHDAAVLLIEKTAQPALDLSTSAYLQSDYIFTGWSTSMSPHFLLNHVGDTVRDGDRAYQTLEFSNEGVFKASWKPDGSDMQIIELSKLSLAFIPGEEGHTFSIEFSPE